MNGSVWAGPLTEPGNAVTCLYSVWTVNITLHVWTQAVCVKSVFSWQPRCAGLCGLKQLGESRRDLPKCDRDCILSVVPTVCRSSVWKEVNNLSCLHCFRELASIKSSDLFYRGWALSSDRGGIRHGYPSIPMGMRWAQISLIVYKTKLCLLCFCIYPSCWSCPFHLRFSPYKNIRTLAQLV
jgi:hypothetical protein